MSGAPEAVVELVAELRERMDVPRAVSSSSQVAEAYDRLVTTELDLLGPSATLAAFCLGYVAAGPPPVDAGSAAAYAGVLRACARHLRDRGVRGAPASSQVLQDVLGAYPMADHARRLRVLSPPAGRLRWAVPLALAAGMLLWIAGRPPSDPGTRGDGVVRRALLVGVDDYTADPRYASLHASTDIALLRAALEARGFHPADIRVLEDPEATADGIRDAFHEHLVRLSAPGDVAVFHYSGHGNRLTDQDGDEPDGYDEVLVPYLRSVCAAKGSTEPCDGVVIRDEELGRWLDAVAERVGPSGSVLAAIDACHAGTPTRGPAIRGGSSPLGRPVPCEACAPRGVADREDTGPVAVLGASLDGQRAREVRLPTGEPAGALSFALAVVLRQLAPGGSNGDLFDAVRAHMAQTSPYQDPSFHGERDRTALAGDEAPRATLRADPELVVSAGTLDGLLPGAELVTASGQRLTVAEVRATTAVLRRPDGLEVPPEGLDLTLATRVFAPPAVRVDAPADWPWAPNRGEAPPGARLPWSADDVPDVVLARSGDGWTATGADRQVLFDGDDDAALVARLERHARAVYLGALRAGQDVHVGLRAATWDGGRCAAEGPVLPVLALPAEGVYQLVVHNGGAHPVHLNVLELDTDDRLDALLGPGTPVELSVDAGAPAGTACFRLGPGGGTRLVWFASRGPLDLGGLLAGGTGRGSVASLLAPAVGAAVGTPRADLGDVEVGSVVLRMHP